MIARVKITNFKCFDETTIELKNFNLLAGMNSTGKSTFIQAILLVIQNITNEGIKSLNGDLVSLGEFSDIRNIVTNAENFSITLYNEIDESLELFFEEKGGNVQLTISNNNEDLKAFFHQENKKVRYLTSKGMSYQDLHQKEDKGIFEGSVIDFYESNKTILIDSILLIEDKDVGSTLEHQLNYWLKYIMNIQLSTIDVNGTDIVKAQFAYNKHLVRPRTMGASLSYVISILVCGLTSKIGDLNIIENPEIHLHPSTQSKLTEFLIFVSNKGIKFIIETHSDHIFNGMRKAINKNLITPEKVSTYFFSIDDETLCANPKQIIFNTKGIVQNHQNGLFDQFDNDLDEMLGLC